MKGQAILFAIFLMTVVFLGGFIFSQIFLRTIKVSDTLINSIVAFHAAESGLEHALYNERKIPPQAQPSGCVSVGAACYQVLRGESPTYIILYAIGNYRDASRSVSSFFEK